MNLLLDYEKTQMEKISSQRTFPTFNVGDTLTLDLFIQEEGAPERTQKFSGLVIAKRNRTINSSFILRRVVKDIDVERKFMIYSPSIKSIEVVKRGIVRRAKLYYQRGRSGKSARIKEKIIR